MVNALKRAEYYQFVKFIATPYFQRDLKTQEEFQIEYMVSGDTLARWKKDPDFWEDVRRETVPWCKERTPNVLGALYYACVQDRNPSAIRLWLQYNEKFSIKSAEEPEKEKEPQTFTELMEWADAEFKKTR